MVVIAGDHLDAWRRIIRGCLALLFCLPGFDFPDGMIDCVQYLYIIDIIRTGEPHAGHELCPALRLPGTGPRTTP